jgi:hypothetical protein
MRFLVLAGALAACGDVASSPLTHSVTLAVYTKKLAAVTDLKAEELAISEGGHERRILAVERDERRLDVAIVIDSSAGVAASYRSELVPGVIEFWKAMPPGTAVAVWTTAPAKVADFGSDPAVVEPKLRTVAAAGGNYAIDSMTDACKELGTRGAPRRAVVYVGGVSLLGNAQNTAELMRAVGVARAVPMSVLLLAGGNGAGGGGMSGNAVHSFDVQGYFGGMAKGYFGFYVESLSPLAVAQWLRQAAADLNGQYHVVFESEPGPGGVLKVSLKRKDAKLRVGRTETHTPGSN